ncbi:alpha/beta fold hydrolase [Streptomyces sp. NPDC048197]|uniref:alpha/beta fold hydrolase n=1 Tax=Streptomyces sp. NPDC048197 TaxID=3365511 RepID=UPI0037132D74
MRPSVVYVHGNGNKVRPDLLKSQWDTALFGRDMGAASRMAYWAPVRYPAPLPDHRPDPLDGGPEPAKGSPAGLEGRATNASAAVPPPEEFVARTLDEARQETGGTAPERRARPDEDALADWLRDMTYLADTLAHTEAAPEPGPADALPLEVVPLPRPGRTALFRALVQHAFKDVYAYFFGGAGPAMRAVMQEALDGLDGGPLVVVGHSLGTVIAYEVLREQQRNVALLVTVGSPLAITEIQDRLARPPAVPDGVAAWRNASDLRDLVALDHTLRPEYAPEDRVTDVLVTNDSRNHHSIDAYLSQHPVREPVLRIFGDGPG